MDWHPITIHERSPTPTCAVRWGCRESIGAVTRLLAVRGRVRSIGLPRGTSTVPVYTPHEVRIRRTHRPISTNAIRYIGCRCLSYRSHSFSRLRRLSKAASGQFPHSSEESPQRPYNGVSRGEYDTPLSRYATGRDATRDRFESRRALLDASRRRRRLTSSVSQTDHPADSHCIGLDVSKRLWR